MGGEEEGRTARMRLARLLIEIGETMVLLEAQRDRDREVLAELKRAAALPALRAIGQVIREQKVG